MGDNIYIIINNINISERRFCLKVIPDILILPIFTQKIIIFGQLHNYLNIIYKLFSIIDYYIIIIFKYF